MTLMLWRSRSKLGFEDVSRLPGLTYDWRVLQFWFYLFTNDERDNNYSYVHLVRTLIDLNENVHSNVTPRVYRKTRRVGDRELPFASCVWRHLLTPDSSSSFRSGWLRPSPLTPVTHRSIPRGCPSMARAMRCYDNNIAINVNPDEYNSVQSLPVLLS